MQQTLINANFLKNFLDAHHYNLTEPYRTDRLNLQNNEHVIVTLHAKGRKWVQHERRYSNAMWYVDWHVIEDPRWEDLWLICYMDDASRCITCCDMYQYPTSENTVYALEEAIKGFGAPAQILSDQGVQFTSLQRSREGPRNRTLFEEELDRLGIVHLVAKINYPRTINKIKRFFGTFETEIEHCDRISEYVDYYNESRLHFSLDIDNGETPLMAFRAKRASAEIRADPKWADEELG